MDFIAFSTSQYVYGHVANYYQNAQNTPLKCAVYALAIVTASVVLPILSAVDFIGNGIAGVVTGARNLSAKEIRGYKKYAPRHHFYAMWEAVANLTNILWMLAFPCFVKQMTHGIWTFRAIQAFEIWHPKPRNEQHSVQPQPPSSEPELKQEAQDHPAVKVVFKEKAVDLGTEAGRIQLSDRLGALEDSVNVMSQNIMGDNCWENFFTYQKFRYYTIGNLLDLKAKIYDTWDTLSVSMRDNQAIVGNNEQMHETFKAAYKRLSKSVEQLRHPLITYREKMEEYTDQQLNTYGSASDKQKRLEELKLLRTACEKNIQDLDAYDKQMGDLDTRYEDFYRTSKQLIEKISAVLGKELQIVEQEVKEKADLVLPTKETQQKSFREGTDEIFKKYALTTTSGSYWTWFEKGQVDYSENANQLWKLFLNPSAEHFTDVLDRSIKALSQMSFVHGKIVASDTVKRRSDMSCVQDPCEPKLLFYFEGAHSEAHLKEAVALLEKEFADVEKMSAPQGKRAREDGHIVDQWGPSFTKKRNALMFYGQGGFTESGRDRHVIRKTLAQNFDGENYYLHKGQKDPLSE